LGICPYFIVKQLAQAYNKAKKYIITSNGRKLQNVFYNIYDNAYKEQNAISTPSTIESYTPSYQ